MDRFTTEKQLQAPLLRWLRETRRLRAGAEVFEEMSWFGRKVDLVTVSRSRRVVAYELKLNSFRRAVEQAAYNRISFDRAYVVTAAHPTAANLELAVEAGVGVLVITLQGVTEITPSPITRAAKELRKRLLAALHEVRSDVREPILALP